MKKMSPTCKKGADEDVNLERRRDLRDFAVKGRRRNSQRSSRDCDFHCGVEMSCPASRCSTRRLDVSNLFLLLWTCLTQTISRCFLHVWKKIRKLKQDFCLLSSGAPCLQSLTTANAQTKDQDAELSKLCKDGEHGKTRAPSDAQSNIFVLRKMVEEVFTVLYSKDPTLYDLLSLWLVPEAGSNSASCNVQVKLWERAAWSLCLMSGSRRTPALWWPTVCLKESHWRSRRSTTSRHWWRFWSRATGSSSRWNGESAVGSCALNNILLSLDNRLLSEHLYRIMKADVSHLTAAQERMKKRCLAFWV